MSFLSEPPNNRPTRVLSAPTARETANLALNGIAADAVVVLLCACDVEYDGRAGGYLPRGDRTIMIKPDGNFLVIGSSNHKPRNWQPTGAETTVDVVDETLVLHSTRTSPKEETLTVHCDAIYEALTFAAGDDPDVVLNGTEKDMHRRIMDSPSLIEDGFEPTANEKPVDSGRKIDVFGYDADDVPVVVEVKRRRGQRKHVDQLNDYTRQIAEPTVRGILAAPSASQSVHDALDARGLEFVTVQPRSADTS
jgi:RecB family endonuclease NucS